MQIKGCRGITASLSAALGASSSAGRWVAISPTYFFNKFLRRFVSGLTRDRDAVEAALHLPWSNGPVEGQVHRLKLIKRQMYGRASFDLLRLRVLHKP